MPSATNAVRRVESGVEGSTQRGLCQHIRLAAKHAITVKNLDYAMGYADDMLSDAVFAVETASERDIEEQDPV